MNTIFRNTRVLAKRFYANGLIVQRANFSSSGDRRRFGPLGKPGHYSVDPLIVDPLEVLSHLPTLLFLTIMGGFGFVIFKREVLFGSKKAQEDKQKKKKKWLFVYNSKSECAPAQPHRIEYPFDGLEEGKSSGNNQNYWTNPKNIQKSEESVSVDRVYLKSK